MIFKSQSLVVSETIFNLVLAKDDFCSEFDGSLDTFNNCRETGLVLTVSKRNGEFLESECENIHIWVHQNRNSDEMAVRWGNSCDKSDYNMFTNEVCDEVFTAEDGLAIQGRGTRYFESGAYAETAEWLISAVEYLAERLSEI